MPGRLPTALNRLAALNRLVAERSAAVLSLLDPYLGGVSGVLQVG